MFTGLITGVGTVTEVIPIGDGRDARIVIAVPAEGDWANVAAVKLGASIACSGCCLTVVERAANFFAVEVSAESLNVTTLGAWRPGSKINLEGSLRLGDEMGGHIVSGHVDGLATIVSITPENGSHRWRFAVPAALGRFIAAKGSVAVNGVSLTVNDVADGGDGSIFGVNIIAHTSANTNFSALTVGERVNIEIDMLARYIARMQEFK